MVRLAVYDPLENHHISGFFGRNDDIERGDFGSVPANGSGVRSLRSRLYGLHVDDGPRLARTRGILQLLNASEKLVPVFGSERSAVGRFKSSRGSPYAGNLRVRDSKREDGKGKNGSADRRVFNGNVHGWFSNEITFFSIFYQDNSTKIRKRKLIFRVFITNWHWDTKEPRLGRGSFVRSGLSGRILHALRHAVESRLV